MSGFDRTAAILGELDGLTDNSIDRIAELRTSGPHFHSLMGEIRDAVRSTYDGGDVDGDAISGDTIVDEKNVTPGDATLLEVFAGMQAAQDLAVAEVVGDYDTVFELVRAAVTTALGNGVGLLVGHLESAADDADADYDAEADYDEDEGEDEGEDDE